VIFVGNLQVFIRSIECELNKCMKSGCLNELSNVLDSFWCSVNDTFFDFFTLPLSLQKQLKLRGHSRGLTLIPESVSKRKICSMHKIFSL